MSKSKLDSRFTLTKSDMAILLALLGSPEGLRWNDLARKTDLSPRTLSKRLKKLVRGRPSLVERLIEKNAHPPTATYKLRQSFPEPLGGDFDLGFEAVRSFHYIKKLDSFTAMSHAIKQVCRSKEDSAKIIKRGYSRLYPYFVWCLYYASRAETDFAEGLILETYVDALKKMITGIVRPAEKYLEIFKEYIGVSWNVLKEKELKSAINEGRNFFVSRFPTDLRDLAESYYYFYLDKRIESSESVLGEFKPIVHNKYARREFESHFGKEVPKYRLDSFLSVLTGLYPTESPQQRVLEKPDLSMRAPRNAQKDS